MGDVDQIHPNFTRRPYEKWLAYGQFKTAYSLFVAGVAAFSGLDNVVAFAVHPGGIRLVFSGSWSSKGRALSGEWAKTAP